MNPSTAGATRVGSGRLRITVENLWLLYLYASPLYALLSQDERVRAEASPQQLPELLVRVLCREVDAKLNRGLTQRYQDRHEVLTSVRGRIDHLSTARANLLAKGMVSCEFHELTVDTPRNRYVLAALMEGHGLLTCSPSRATAAALCRTTAARMSRLGVQIAPTDRRTPLSEVFGRLEGGDRRMVAAAAMLLEMALPSFHLGSTWVRQLDTLDDQRLRKLFEEAVRGFYQVNLPAGWSAGKRRLCWPGEAEGTSKWPGMETDITITSADQKRLVIDTKFTAALTDPRDGREPTLRSGHLYQICTYLFSQEDPESSTSKPASGVLLYPSTDRAPVVHAWRIMGGHRVGVETVDLSTSPVEVGDQLRAVVATHLGQPAEWTDGSGLQDGLSPVERRH